MNEYRPIVESVHDLTKSAKVLRGRRLEIHRNVNVRHSKARDDAALVRDRVIGGRKSKVDYRFEASITYLAKLGFCGLACSGKLTSERTEIVDVRE